MSEHPLKAYEHWRDASQRFDYFVTGATGALCAYIAQHLEPKRLGLSPYTLELLALGVLIVSIVLGFKLIEDKVHLLKASAQKLAKEELYGALISKFRGGYLINQPSGDILGPETVTTQIAGLPIEISFLKEKEDKLVESSGVAYRWRNRSLILGVSLLAISRIIIPYFP